MAQIGAFTRNEDGSFTGAIRTLNINVAATFEPVDKPSGRSPHYRITAHGPGFSGVELGAGWRKTGKTSGADFVSVKLDDPAFPAPVYASLVEGEAGEHRLIWSR
jgi:uncharacterized protein (DUF736 family)